MFVALSQTKDIKLVSGSDFCIEDLYDIIRKLYEVD